MSMLHVNYLTGGGDNDGGVKGNKAGKPVTTVRVCVTAFVNTTLTLTEWFLCLNLTRA